MSRLYDGSDLRSSYVVWQEGINPFLVVELLSPGTDDEDLGTQQVPCLTEASASQDQPLGNGSANRSASDRAPLVKAKPPRKWEVYEQILRVP